MSNLVSSRTRTVHAAASVESNVPLCGARVATLNGNTGHLSITCGNCRRMITRAHAEALELHQAFLLGVAQAEVPAEQPDRAPGEREMSNLNSVASEQAELCASVKHFDAFGDAGEHEDVVGHVAEHLRLLCDGHRPANDVEPDSATAESRYVDEWIGR